MSVQRQKFVDENKEEVTKVFQRESAKRAKRNIPPLTPQEIDEALDTMMDLVRTGSRIRAYKFPETSEPIQPPPQNLQTPASIRKLPKAKSEHPSFLFEAMVCENGFTLTAIGPDGTKPFIFKNERELMQIFRDLVFPELEKLKAKKVPFTTNSKGQEIAVNMDIDYENKAKEEENGTTGTDQRDESGKDAIGAH